MGYFCDATLPLSPADLIFFAPQPSSMSRRNREAEKKGSHHARTTGKIHDDSDSDSDSDLWKHIQDPVERRRVQNRLSQRKFRDKAKAEKEEASRHRQNQAAARSAYTQPDPDELGDDNHHSGLPWGEIPTRYVIASSRVIQERQQQRDRTDRRTQERVVVNRPHLDEPYTLFERTTRRPLSEFDTAETATNMGPPERPDRRSRHERGTYPSSTSHAEERDRARAREERHRR